MMSNSEAAEALDIMERNNRSREVGNALQATVAADPEIAVSIVGMAVDALSSVLIHTPDQLPTYGPWVELINGVYEYVMTGAQNARIRELLAGTLTIREE